MIIKFKFNLSDVAINVRRAGHVQTLLLRLLASVAISQIHVKNISTS